ncbi:hypothetical protein [Kitasatospora cheerisanensis]|uniref:Histone deacetylase n=1 Tax=Kitasatospora cheerisanensis KCTC 2395 TaxID=1348663 RepID=A0A066YIA9_9ACTN|nr:hypothetical protein [Kitasatospora cheerisanensis]KDN81193.1 hypothetical protein KCH_70040 [Kitasatospora cheerisanensis KCTC 2395]
MNETPPAARRPQALPGTPLPWTSVWYAAYGSNMHAVRLGCYIAGGRPPGCGRTYPGCRDRTLPARTVPLLLPGTLYFAFESLTWGGAMGLYDPAPAGEMPARAYLVTAGQFADIAAQEMHREPGIDLDLGRAVTTGRDRLGPGRYETLVCAGTLDGIPVLTFTCPWTLADAELNPPTPAYLANFASGLAESHGWTLEQSAAYLATRPGAAGHWSPATVVETLAAL